MPPIRMERLEIAVRTVIAYTEAFNQHELSVMLSLLSRDCIYESPSPSPDGAVYRGKAALKEYWQSFFVSHPDAHLKIEEAIGYGLRCIALWRCDWTDVSGISKYIRGVDLFRLENGLITEQISYTKS
jgi:predicted SnoaL-like aldol condensation-catalyzing enzyme